MRLALRALLVGAAIGGFSMMAGRTPTAQALNCIDFSSQAAAQAFLRANPTDPEGLDADKDGIACEDLPAPRDEVPVPRPTATTAAPSGPPSAPQNTGMSYFFPGALRTPGAETSTPVSTRE